MCGSNTPWITVASTATGRRLCMLVEALRKFVDSSYAAAVALISPLVSTLDITALVASAMSLSLGSRSLGSSAWALATDEAAAGVSISICGKVVEGHDAADEMTICSASRRRRLCKNYHGPPSSYIVDIDHTGRR